MRGPSPTVQTVALAVTTCVVLGSLIGASQDALPDGPGKDILQSTCTKCHGLNRVTSAGYTRDGWLNVVNMMVNAGATLTPDQITTLTDYLAANFPERSSPQAVIIPGAVKVTINEWVVPVPGSRPHDPLATADGDIWYTGQMANELGRLDPRTGGITEYRLPIADSGPHGLVADASGHIWFTANFKGYIGDLDPQTGNVRPHFLAADARDPHTPLFDQQGILWFTVQGADMVGRLNPKTGTIKVVDVPTARANPYGMVITSKGVPYFAEFGTNKLASIDPSTMAITEYVLPNAGARPRRVAITSDDVIYYTDYARGYLGRFDLRTGAFAEWPSPGGPNSRPYGITVLGDAVWYSESGVKPNTIVRFDPVATTFQTWAIPSGGGVVRNMMPTRDGNIAIACSGVNRIGLVMVVKGAGGH
ncbi:MAG: cytochrome C [Candidatus Eremiobacteraeota bacterium]|nr:cytochrome C [Candidatus Eremiobacteraeota bacterium]